jgi:HEAT repeat protein/type 1 glutamine amidotransferase
VAGVGRIPERFIWNEEEIMSTRHDVRCGAWLSGALLCAALLGGAAAGEMTADEAFAQVKAFDYGKDLKALRLVERLVQKAVGDRAAQREMAQRLIAILSEPQAAEGARLFCCQQLAFVGSENDVPLLAKLLEDAKTEEMARYALQVIPGEASRAALRSALEKAQGEALIGVVNTLGACRDAQAVEALAKRLTHPDAKVAAAAVRALGRIGTPQAAEALGKAQPAKPVPAEFLDALLGCAERLAAAGDPAAGLLYQQLAAPDQPRLVRLAALRGLATTRQAQALPMVLEAIGGSDTELQAIAMGLLRQIPGPEATRAMVELMGKLKGRDLAALMDALGQRGDKSAREAVAAYVDAQDEAVRAAAVEALGRLGDVSTVSKLLQLATEPGPLGKVARTSLTRLSGPGVDEALLAAAEKSEPAARVILVRALADRGAAAATPMLLKALADADANVRRAAVEALSAVGTPDSYAKLVEALLGGMLPADPAEKALLAMAGRMPEPAARLAPVVAALPAAQPEGKASLIRVLRGLSGAEALRAVRAALSDTDATVRDAAVRALADWNDDAPVDDLLKIVKESPDATHRVLALRGYLRLARTVKGGPEQQLRLLRQVQQVVTAPDARKMLLAGLSDVADPGALEVAAGMLGEEGLQAEAAVAVLRIARAIAQAHPAAVKEALEKVVAANPSAQIAQQARAMLDTANRPAVDEVQALKHDAARSEALKKDLARRAPKGFTLACYLDCGPDSTDGAKGGPELRVVPCSAHFWPESDRSAHFRFGTVWYAADEVRFEVSSLNPKKAYAVGLSWWDYDGNGRVQSVALVTGKGEKSTQVVKPAKLPSFTGANEMPAEVNATIPPALYADGTLQIAIRREGASNAVVSEIWLWEGAEGSAGQTPDLPQSKAEPVAAAPAPTAAEVAAIIPGKEEPGRTTRILVITGIDYPGHKWRETCPVFVADLNQDPRLRVDVVEDPRVLCSEKINQYAALVMHWMNWEKPDPGEAARASLKAYVEGGKGLVFTHFACGAFQAWPEFRRIAGRGWDPKLRGHDAYGKFQVRMTETKHSITEGLAAFEVTDELYTCLAGDAPISVLCAATSNVDKKDYPIAFVLEPGKGRVFHCVLGHDAQVWKTPAAAELARRGTAWAAGLKPVP